MTALKLGRWLVVIGGILTVVGLGVVWVRWVRRLWLGRARTLAPPWMARGLVVLIIAFWILRNLPGFEFLGPPRG